MKKTAIFSLLLLGLSFTSCDEVEDMTGVAQTNPEIPGYDISQLQVSSPMGNTLNIIDLNDAGVTTVPVVTISNPGNLPEGYTLTADYTLGDENFVKSVTLPVTFDGEAGYLSTEDIENAFEKIYGAGPSMRVLYGRAEVYAKNADGTVIRLGGENTYYGEVAFECTPDTGLVLEDSYYLMGTMCDWSMPNAIKFTATGTDPWTNPVFFVEVEITQAMMDAGCWWKVVPGSVQATGDWGSGLCSQWGVETNGDEALEGTLIPMNKAGEEPGAGCLKDLPAGTYKWTINVLEGTYKITEVLPVFNLWTPGNANGWNAENSQMLFSDNGETFTGYAHLDAVGFKFTSQPNWDGVNYGNSGEDGKLSDDGGAGNLVAPADGLYYCDVNIKAMTYSITQITKIGMIGGFNSWGGDVEMTPSADFLTWTGDVEFNAGDEWKFRMNGDWAINLGGSDYDLVQNGGNLVAPGAGTYTVTLDLSKLPYSCTLVKK